jgi:hypothetical protein
MTMEGGLPGRAVTSGKQVSDKFTKLPWSRVAWPLPHPLVPSCKWESGKGDADRTLKSDKRVTNPQVKQLSPQAPTWPQAGPAKASSMASSKRALSILLPEGLQLTAEWADVTQEALTH